jgi:hypothetical protein
MIAELNRAGPRFTTRKTCYIKMQINFRNDGRERVLLVIPAMRIG